MWFGKSLKIGAIIACFAVVGAMGPAQANFDATGDSDAGPDDSLVGNSPELIEFGQISYDLEMKFPNHVLESRWDPDRQAGMITVVPGSEAMIREAIVGYLITPDVVAGRSDSIAVGSRDAVTRAAMEAIEAVNLGKVTGGEYFAETNTVQVDVIFDDGVTQADLSRAIAISTEPIFNQVFVRVNSVGPESQLQLLAVGGKPYGSDCTGGFIAKKDSTTGIVTAGHCTTTPGSYNGATTGTTWSLYGGGHDVKFTALTTGTHPNKIQYNSSGSTKNITSVGLAATSATVTKWGLTTGSTTSTVFSSSSVCRFDGSVNLCGLIRTTPVNWSFGDSGGPVYIGNKAVGIVTGKDASYNYYSMVGLITLIPGMSIKTAP